MLRHLLLLAIWGGLAAIATRVEAANASSGPRVGPVPSWATPLLMPSQSDLDACVRGNRPNTPGIGRYLIEDEQERFAASSHEFFSHYAYVVSKPTDVQQGSELTVRYAPDYEQLTVHYVRIYRERRRIDALRSAQIRTLDAELDRERFLYDAEQNVLFVLEDVRPGDAIEWAYTISGQNPAIAGHVLGVTELEPRGFVSSQLFRLLVPNEAAVSYRHYGDGTKPQVASGKDFTEYLWRRTNVSAVEDEGNTPAWQVPGSWVEYSDFASWREVVDWARPLYGNPTTLPAELTQLIEQWRRLPGADAKIEAALRFVQEEIRYLGMEIGPYSLVPHPPEQTFVRRFGDCKDKTLLLVTILQKLGIDAVPALVSSQKGRKLGERLPSPLVFDHVITKVQLEGQSYWFDPTLTHERGDRQSHAFSDFYFALPLAAGTQALDALKPPPIRVPLSEIEERYELGELNGPIELTVKTVLRGARADEFRARLEQQGPTDLNREYSNFFAKRFDGVESIGLPGISDDQTANVLTVQEHYRMRSLFRDEEVRLTPWSFEEVLAPPDLVRRKTALSVTYPFSAEHRIVLTYDRRPDFEPPNVELEDESLRFLAKSVRGENGKETTISFSLCSLSDAVDVAEVEHHLALRRRIDRALELRIRPPQPPRRSIRSERHVTISPYLAGLLGGFLTLGLQAIIRYRRRPSQSTASGASSSSSSSAPSTDSG